VAGIYTILFLLALWIFPLFPAEPKLGPVYQRVTHMVPLAFPILIVVPAFALDWLWPRVETMLDQSSGTRWLRTPGAVLAVIFAAPIVGLNVPFSKDRQTAITRWAQAAVAALIFLTALIAVQWPFANLMISPASANWFFGTTHHPYMVPSDWAGVKGTFLPFETTAQFWRNMAWAFFAALMSIRLGMTFGNWMRKVQR
jgi:hypothetical protein